VGNVDARITAESLTLAAWIGLGLDVDYAVTSFGGMVLTVGGGIEYDECFVACFGLGAVYSSKVSDGLVTPTARAKLHFPLSSGKPIDIYLTALLGLTFGFHRETANSGAWAWNSSTVGPAIGASVGANYFYSERFYTGTDIALMYQAWSYTPTFTTGFTSLANGQTNFGGTALWIKVYMGMRFG
jgi:hypothetical protein